jgi:hypothetical protein
VKTDSLGETLWSRRYGSTGYYSAGHDVQQTSDHGYIIIADYGTLSGYSLGDVYLIKTDSNGDTLWTRTYGRDLGLSVRQTSDGGYIVAGEGPPLGKGLPGGVYLMKTNASGEMSWTRTYGDSSAAYSVRQTSDGGYIIAGDADVRAPSGSKAYLIKTLADGLVSVRTDHSTVPEGIVLQQNYPNPFNPSTTIKYELPQSAVVRLSVYDMLGREVSVLVHEKKDAGVHEATFDGSALSSGMYVYRLRAGDVVATKRMILMK